MPIIHKPRLAIVAVVAIIVSAAGGLLAARAVLDRQPTCDNAINSYYQRALTDDQRDLFRRAGIERARVQECREGGWSEEMKQCFVQASSKADFNQCPNRWLRAPLLCGEVKAALEQLGKRCGKLPAWTSGFGGLEEGGCSRATGISDIDSVRNCVRAVSSLTCRESHTPASCQRLVFFENSSSATHE